jgi:hypothetical protein
VRALYEPWGRSCRRAVARAAGDQSSVCSLSSAWQSTERVDAAAATEVGPRSGSGRSERAASDAAGLVGVRAQWLLLLCCCCCCATSSPALSTWLLLLLLLPTKLPTKLPMLSLCAPASSSAVPPPSSGVLAALVLESGVLGGKAWLGVGQRCASAYVEVGTADVVCDGAAPV